MRRDQIRDTEALSTHRTHGLTDVAALASQIRLLSIGIVAAVGLMMSQTTFAQDLPHFDAKPYAALADADSAATIAPGTKITAANWQQYKQFLPIGLQLLYSGKFHWKVADSPEYTIEVAPTVAIPKPKKYAEDTEKYKQAKLVAAATGGYNVANYQAGEPFPNPSGDLAGYHALFDNYYQYQPAVLDNPYNQMLQDQYDNRTVLETIEIQTNLGHVSDVGYPIVRPESRGVYLSIFNEVFLPEQSKYTTQLAVIRDDPNLPQELYVFLPSLRRSLRLSAAARCSPLLGSDYVTDDNRGFSGLVNQFTATYLGHKRILNLMHMDRAKRHDLASWNISSYMLGWPKPALGKWELRDAYVYNLQPVASNNSYCYGSKVLYMDADTQTLLFGDIYDKDQRFWKCFTNLYAPIPVNDGLGSQAGLQGDTTSTMFDFQNKHASFAWTAAEVKINHDVPATYREVELYALPSGLSQILK